MGDGLEAIVIGRQDLGESDRIVRLLTAELGKVDAVARGARASKRRFGGSLDPGTRLLVGLRRGKGDLATLVSADVVAAPRRAREDYERLMLLSYGCDVLSVLSEHGLETHKGFGLLGAWLDALEADVITMPHQRLAFEAKALTFAGIAPQLLRCPVCGEPLEDPVVFDCEAGGGVHAAHGTGPAVPVRALATLEYLRRTPMAEVVDVPLPGPSWWLLADFVEYQARAPLRSRGLLSPPEDM